MTGQDGVLLGSLIDAAGVRSQIDEGELVESFLVIMKVHCNRPGPSVRLAWSDGMSWIDRRALIEIARDVERVQPEDEERL